MKIDTPNWPASMARRLRAIVVEKMRVYSAWSERSWANQFKELRKECDNDAARVEAMLDWLEANHAKLKIKILCAETFRRRFNTLFEIASYDKPKEKPKTADVIEMILTDIRDECLEWPNGEPLQLEQAVTDIYAEARIMMPLLEATSKQDDDEGYLARVLREDIGKSPESAAVHWVRWVCNDVSNWREWGGSFKNRGLNPHSDFFLKFLNIYSAGKVVRPAVARLVRSLRTRWPGAVAQ